MQSQDTVTLHVSNLSTAADEIQRTDAMTKIMFYGTYPNRPIGYSKIANTITNHLASQPDTHVYYVGISNFEDGVVDRFVHPSITLFDALKLSRTLRQSDELYGVDVIEDIMEKVQPDVFIVYNDCIVTCRLFNALLNYKASHPNKTKFVSYLDLVYPFQKKRYIEHINRHSDRLFVFSPFWKQNLVDMGVESSKISVFPHGVDRTATFRTDKQLAKLFMNFRPDDYVVLNNNRNSYRKAHDIAIRAFLMFLKTAGMPSNVKMFINFNMGDSLDYILEEMLATECCRLRLDYDTIVNSHVYSFPVHMRGSVSDETINMLYNACDVGVNSCLGEGFGLCNAEHASVDRPQIVSKVGGLQDIFEPCQDMLVEPSALITVPNVQDDHNGDAYVCKAEDFADRLLYFYTHREQAADKAKSIGEHIRSTYDWDVVLKQFSTDLESMYT